MRQILGVVIVCAALLGGRDAAGARCGDVNGDAAAMAAAEASVAARCDCCTPHSRYSACVASVLRSALRGRALPGRCVAKTRRHVARVCPPPPTTASCRACNADTDCAASEFCQCRVGSCTRAGGVCTPLPPVCPDVVLPVCACDGTTYANECLRQQARACKLHDGPCVATGGCFDTIAGGCTGEACSPVDGCQLPDQFCSPMCGTPPPTGTCFDTFAHRCTTQVCGAGHPCLPHELCVPACPPPPPEGKCFVTVEGRCSDEPCGPGAPCRNPNELCSPRCLATTTTTTLPSCTSDADCDDGNGCSVDRCLGGTCAHLCVCVDVTGAASCCPGPGALCAKPCGADPAGTCGGLCPAGATCEDVGAGAATCGCVSGLGGPCGGNVLAPPPVCAPGLVCEQSNPDATGVCVAASCIPFFAPGCSRTSDCCRPCEAGIIAPCAVCIGGTCLGAPGAG